MFIVSILAALLIGAAILYLMFLTLRKLDNRMQEKKRIERARKFDAAIALMDENTERLKNDYEFLVMCTSMREALSADMRRMERKIVRQTMILAQTVRYGDM